MNRPHLSNEINSHYTLKTDDPLNRYWKDADGKIVVLSEAWIYRAEDDEEIYDKCVRLNCASQLLKNILTDKKPEILITIKTGNLTFFRVMIESCV